MEIVNLKQKIDEAGKDSVKNRNMHLFGTDNFRSWMLYFEPGDGTPMHYHQSPETFLVVDGQCSVKAIDGFERVLEKDDIVFCPQRNTTSSRTSARARWCSSAIVPSPSAYVRCAPKKSPRSSVALE
jgi:hypothetical protein